MTKTQLNLHKTKIIAILAITIGLAFPSIGPHISYAQTAPSAEASGLPPHVVTAINYMHQQISLHPGWVGMISWNATSAKFDYLGPASSNPFKVNQAGHPPTGQQGGAPPPAASTLLSTGVSPTQDTTSGSTSEFKEIQDFKSNASNTNTDQYQILNAMSSGNNHWFQVGLTYDNGDVIGASPSWRAAYNSWTVSNCGNDFSTASVAQTESTGDSIEAYIMADASQAGHYTMGITDVTKNNGALTGFSVTGDSGHSINLGQQADGTTCIYPSGPMEEEISGAIFPTKYNFGHEPFTMGFYDTSTSGKTTSVNGWNAATGSSCISTSTQNNPAKATFTYGAC